MIDDNTIAAFTHLRAFATNVDASSLDRLVAANAAAWLAHGTCYGITGEPKLVKEIADTKKYPVERAITLIQDIVATMTQAGFPLSTPFQEVELLYDEIKDEGSFSSEYDASNVLQGKIERGPYP